MYDILCKYLIRAVLCLLLILMNFLLVQAGQADSLRNRLNRASEQEKVDILRKLFVHYHLKNLDSAEYFIQSSFNVAFKVTDSLGMAKAANAQGWIYNIKGYYVKAIKEYEYALLLAQSLRDQKQVVANLNSLANAYYNFGVYDKALEYHLNSLAIREEEGDTRGIAISLNNIGLVYKVLDNYEGAIRSFKRSLKLREESGRERETAYPLLNLASVYIDLEGYDEALEYLNSVIELCEDGCDDDRIEMEAYQNIGNIFLEKEEYKEAIRNFFRSKGIAVSNKSRGYQVSNDHYLAKTEFVQGNYQKALDYLDQSQENAIATRHREMIMNNYKLYANIYNAQHDFKTAFEYEEKYSVYRDSIFNEDVAQKLTAIQLNFEQERAQKIIEQKDTVINRATKVNFLLVLVVLLFGTILFILQRNYKQKQRANQELREAKAIIEKQNEKLTNVNAMLEEKVKERTKELNESNLALIKSNSELDNFIYKTSHDIRGPLASLKGICNVALMDIKELVALDYFKKLDHTAEKLNEILSKLLIINQINNASLVYKEIDFAEVVDHIFEAHQHMEQIPKIDVRREIDQSISFFSDPHLIHVILNNLIHNAIKFYNNSDRIKSFILTKVTSANKHLVVDVIDNGIGIKNNQIHKIFEIFSKASERSDSAGLGLYLVKLAVERLKGKITVETTKEQYTKFTVSLPIEVKEASTYYSLTEA